MVKRIKALAGVLRESGHPFKLILGLILMKSRLNKLFTIRMDGYKLNFSQSALALTLFADSGERHNEEDFIKRVLEQGNIYVDTGANIGTLALAAARVVGDTGKVIAIEPHPVTFGYLKSNVVLNKFKNIRLIHSAAGKETGAISFSNSNSDDQNKVLQNQEGIKVPVNKLDNLLSEVGQINLLKIDVEGYEKFVLEGAAVVLDRTEAVLYESWEKHNNNYGYTTKELTRFMNQKGFSVYKVYGDRLEPVSDSYISENCENLVAVKDIARFCSSSGFTTR